MFFTAALFLSLVSSISAASITASDLPECAIDCYCLAGEQVQIPITDYEGQCRSAPFQIALRTCCLMECDDEEYEFTDYHAKEYCSQFGVDIDKVLEDFEANEEFLVEEVPTEINPDLASDVEIASTTTSCSTLCNSSPAITAPSETVKVTHATATASAVADEATSTHTSSGSGRARVTAIYCSVALLVIFGGAIML